LKSQISSSFFKIALRYFFEEMAQKIILGETARARTTATTTIKDDALCYSLLLQQLHNLKCDAV